MKTTTQDNSKKKPLTQEEKNEHEKKTSLNIIYIIVYLGCLLAVIILIYFLMIMGKAPKLFIHNKLLTMCVLTGITGGLLYAFRAIYTHRCKDNDWNNRYVIWYYLRPLISSITGGISWLLLKAGIVLLSASPTDSSAIYGYLAFALIAGYNVEHFLEKFEDIMQAVWGINKSDQGSDNSSSEENDADNSNSEEVET